MHIRVYKRGPSVRTAAARPTPGRAAGAPARDINVYLSTNKCSQYVVRYSKQLQHIV